MVAAALLAARAASRRSLDALLAAVVTAQMVIAESAIEAGSVMLAEQGIRDDPVAEIVPAALAGWASDGRLLRGLLDYALRTATGAEFDRIVATQLQDVARQSEALFRAARPAVTRWTRALSLPSCGRCIVLAGRVERSDVAFSRHPNCFPAGVIVSGPELEAATRRWYDGELVILTTASGKELSVTGNHPVLTRSGWVPANRLKEGDEVVSSARAEGASALVVPHHDQVPALVEDVWGSFSVDGLVRVPTSSEDFHGDGQDGEVDVASADGALVGRRVATLREVLSEGALPLALRSAGEFSPDGASVLVDLRDSALSCDLVGVAGLGGSLLFGHSGVSGESGFAPSAAFDAAFVEDSGDWSARYPVLSGDGVFGGAREVGGDDGVGVEVAPLQKWDAPGLAVTVEDRSAYASRGLDLLRRLSGQVEVDRLVDVRRVKWSGHVFNVSSSEGWLSANSLIVSNCDCVSVPSDASNASRLVLTPREAFERMGQADRERAFTVAGAEAIRLGADPVQVVNARRGMSSSQVPLGRGWGARGQAAPVGVYGRGLYVTSEGVTRSGEAGRAMRAAGLDPRRSPRLMPESVLAIAENEADAVRLLKLYGYFR